VVTDRHRSVVAWVAVIGAVSTQDVLARVGVGRTVGYRRLRTLVDHGLVSRPRLVYGQSALYVATAHGVVFAGLGELHAARINRGSVRHWALCALLAVVLEQRERVEVWGEPRLRAAERQAGEPGRQRPAWHVAGRAAAAAPAGSRAVSRCRVAGGGRGRAVGEGRWAPEAICRAGRAARSCPRSAATRRGMWRVPFPVPFRLCMRTTPSESVARRCPGGGS
jgi:hypothetical protein